MNYLYMCVEKLRSERSGESDMETLLIWLFYISSLYAFIPGLITRLFGYRVFKHGLSKDEFALTFDDGPDHYYTPQLLDLLKRYDAKATFFVVGSNAERNPELIRRMHEDGHLIGIHNYVHKTNWLMGPGAVKKQIQKTNKIIHEVTGKDTHYYRPPWGIVNLFDFANRSDVQIVLWSAMFSDWRKRIGAERLTKRMLKKLGGGEVFLLHDCGATLGADNEAPREMLVALERVLDEAQKRGLRSVRIDHLMETDSKLKHSKAEAKAVNSAHSLSWWKRSVVALWLLWEKLFHLIFQLHTANEQNPIFHFRSRSYHGQSVELTDGAILKTGDEVLELHFDNRKLFQMGMRSKSTVHLAIQMIRQVEKALPEIAKYVVDHPELHNVKVLYGVTMINRGSEKFGFTVTDLPKGFFASSSRIYLKFLMRVIHPDGGTRLKQAPEVLVPKLILMPIDLLMKRYLNDGSHHRIKHDRLVEEEEETVISSTLPCR